MGSPIKRIHQLRSQVTARAKDVSDGPERYVLFSMADMLHGTELMIEQTQETGKIIKEFESQVTSFANASDKIEKVMIVLIVIQVVLAAAAISVWFR